MRQPRSRRRLRTLLPENTIAAREGVLKTAIALPQDGAIC